MRRRQFLAGLALTFASAWVLPIDTSLAQRQPGPPPARPAHWELLGMQRVGFAVDHDVIHVGRRDGRFRAIKLRVRGNDMEMRDLKVVYGNGVVEDIQVRRMIRRGGETRTIDLKGEARFIREIRLTYRSRPNFRGRAAVEVWGLQ